MKNLIIAVTFFFIASCASTIPIPTENDVMAAQKSWPTTSLNELHEGRNIYLDRCSGCHSVKPPSVYSEKQWSAILPDMNQKAKLSDNEINLLKKYLTMMIRRIDTNVTENFHH